MKKSLFITIVTLCISCIAFAKPNLKNTKIIYQISITEINSILHKSNNQSVTATLNNFSIKKNELTDLTNNNANFKPTVITFMSNGLLYVVTIEYGITDVWAYDVINGGGYHVGTYS